MYIYIHTYTYMSRRSYCPGPTERRSVAHIVWVAPGAYIICMYIYIYIYTHIHTYIHTHTHTYIYIYIYTHVTLYYNIASTLHCIVT